MAGVSRDNSAVLGSRSDMGPSRRYLKGRVRVPNKNCCQEPTEKDRASAPAIMRNEANYQKNSRCCRGFPECSPTRFFFLASRLVGSDHGPNYLWWVEVAVEDRLRIPIQFTPQGISKKPGGLLWKAPSHANNDYCHECPAIP